MPVEDQAPPPARPPHRTAYFWAAPLTVVGLLLTLLSVLYLGGILHPKESLHDYPLVVVNQDEGGALPGAAPDAAPLEIGAQITAALLANIPADKVALREVGYEEAMNLLYTGRAYGAVVIPPDFTGSTVGYAAAVAQGQQGQRPVVTVYTNPSAGGMTVSLTQGITAPAFERVNEEVGAQLLERLAAQPGAPPLGAAQTELLSAPVDVRTEPREQLPDGTGFGLSAFYYALLLILAGFTGSTVVHTVVDGMLGFTPTEAGPRYRLRERTLLTRTQVLLLKWVLVLVMAVGASSLYLGVATALGMHIPDAPSLWGYGILVVAAVGVTTTSVMAAFGTAGLVVNLVVFIILGLPSSGGAIPLEASPPVYGWLSTFEPMHQILLGTRGLLYYHGRADAGVGHAVAAAFVGLAVGAALGLVATRFYDRRGLHRAPGG